MFCPTCRFQFPFLSCLAITFTLVSVVRAAGLNDTGVTGCFGDSQWLSLDVATDSGTHPRQDCRYGRDAAQSAGKLAKTGAGSKGFDYTKIANDGTVLPTTALLGSGASDWACTRDNVTGLIWEVKTTSGLRNQSHTYTWFSSDPSTNGGIGGTPSGGVCADKGGCDTERYGGNVNAASLCGATDWRMPSRNELGSILDRGRANPAIDTDYFPNTPQEFFWSAMPHPEYVSFARASSFASGNGEFFSRGTPLRVRLVRSPAW